MTYHLFFIVRMLCYFATVILGILLMLRMSDDRLLRRIVAAVSIAAAVFNVWLANIVYSLLASALEALVGIFSVGFVVLLLLVLMLLPLILVVGWLKSK